MTDITERIKSAREELKQIRQGGLRGDIAAKSVEQQLDVPQNQLESRREDWGPKIPERMRNRMERRVDTIEQRIKELK